MAVLAETKFTTVKGGIALDCYYSEEGIVWTVRRPTAKEAKERAEAPHAALTFREEHDDMTRFVEVGTFSFIDACLDALNATTTVKIEKEGDLPCQK